MHGRKFALAGLSALWLLASTPTPGDAAEKPAEATPATVLLRLAKGELPQGCSATHGIIEQGLLRIPGVEDARVHHKTNKIKVTYDPAATGPEDIVASFNKKNPQVPLRLAGSRRK